MGVVDISAMHVDFCMKFYSSVKRKKYSFLFARYVEHGDPAEFIFLRQHELQTLHRNAVFFSTHGIAVPAAKAIRCRISRVFNWQPVSPW